MPRGGARPGAGRPNTYTEEIASELLDRFADGETVEKICMDEHMPKRGTVASWVARDYCGFRQRFFEAFAAKCILEVDRILPIADSVEGSQNMAVVAAAKNMADVRRWMAGRMLAEFSERFVHQHSHAHAVQIVIPDNGRMLIDGQATELLEDSDG
jgi:hypothetical protein